MDDVALAAPADFTRGNVDEQGADNQRVAPNGFVRKA